MPPAYVNVGAYVDTGTLIDSHALVGSCAQIGRRVHISAGAQIGGVLEPAGALPVIVEDDALIGGNCGVYEGAVVRRGQIVYRGCQRGGRLVEEVLGNIHHAQRFGGDCAQWMAGLGTYACSATVC